MVSTHGDVFPKKMFLPALSGSMSKPSREILSFVTGSLRGVGLDLIHPFDALRYNERVAAHDALAPLPVFGRQRALGLLIGNTRALWPHFVAAYRERGDLQNASDPLDTYVSNAVRACAASIVVDSVARFGHERGADAVSMIHLAEASGFAWSGPAYLAVHRDHGPWFGLRAVIVADVDPPDRATSAPDLCRGCEAPCRAALERAMARKVPDSQGDIASSWRDWVAVRDACPIGRSSRYGEAQLRYHYTKERAVLDATT